MNKIIFLLTSSLLHLISLLPFRALYFVSDVLYTTLFYLLKYRRKVVQTNLANAFPLKSNQERHVIEKKYYRYLADMILESIKMYSISEDEMRKRFKYTNFDLVAQHLTSGRSAIAVTAHYGNWEWGSPSISLVNDQPSLVVYKPLTNKDFESFINKMRSRFGAVMVPMKQTLRKVLEYKNCPNLLVLVGDQTPPKNESQFFTEFLNQPTAIFLGIEKIAKLSDVPIFYFHIDRVKRGYYEATIKLLFDRPKETAEHEITLAHTRELEKIIIQKPELWLWSHKRWKFKPEDVAK